MSARDRPRKEEEIYPPEYVSVSEYARVEVGVDIPADAPRYVSVSAPASRSEPQGLAPAVVGVSTFAEVAHEVEVAPWAPYVSVQVPVPRSEVYSTRVEQVPASEYTTTVAEVGPEVAVYVPAEVPVAVDLGSIRGVALVKEVAKVYDVVEVPAAAVESDVPLYIGVPRYASASEAVSGPPPWVSAFLPSEEKKEEKEAEEVLSTPVDQAALAQIARTGYELTGSESAKAVADLLEASSRGDLGAVSQNPIFMMAVKLYEVMPLVDEKTFRSFLVSNGLENFDTVIRKTLRGEPLTLSELNVLYALAELYRQKWNDFASVAMFALDPGDERVRRSIEAWRAQHQPGVLYPLLRAPEREYYEALAKLIARGGDLKLAEWFTESKELVERVAGILGGVDVLGNLSRWVRDAVSGALRGLGVPENVANTVASGVAGFATGATAAFAAKATGGLATPVVLGMIAVSAVRGLFEAGLKLDNPIEAQLLVEALKERWPEIVAGVAGGIAGGYAGARVGDIVGRYIATDLLPHLYDKAVKAGNAKLASAIERVMQRYEQMYSDKLYVLQFRGEKADEQVAVVFDPETGRAYVRFMVYSEGRWHLRGVEQVELRNSWFVRAAGKDFISSYLAEATKNVSAKEALQKLDDLIDEIKGIARVDNLDELANALKKILSQPSFAKHITSVRASVSGDVIALSNPDEVAFYASWLDDTIRLPRYQADALWLYVRLREMRVDPVEFARLFRANADKSSWTARLGDYTVEFSNGKLSIIFRDSKLLELYDVTDDLVKGVTDLHANSAIRGLNLDTLKSFAQAVATRPQVPHVYAATPDIFIKYDQLKQLVDNAVAGAQTGKAAGVEHVVVTRRGTVAIARDVYAVRDEFNAKLLEKVTTAKVLQSDDLFKALQSAAKEAADEVGRGYVLQEFVIAVQPGKAEEVARLLSDAVRRVYEAGLKGDVSTMKSVIADAVQRYVSITGDAQGALGIMSMLVKVGQTTMGGVQAQISIPVAVAQSTQQGTVVMLVGAVTAAQPVQQAQLRQDVEVEAVMEMARRGQLRVSYAGVSEVSTSVVEVQYTPEHRVGIQAPVPQEETRSLDVSVSHATTYSESVEEVRQERYVHSYVSVPTQVPEHVEQRIPVNVAHLTTHTPVVEEVQQERQVPGYVNVAIPRPESTSRDVPVHVVHTGVHTPVVEEVQQEETREDYVHLTSFAPYSETRPLTPVATRVGEVSMYTHEHTEHEDTREVTHLVLRFGLSEEVAAEPVVVTVTVTVPIPTPSTPEPVPTTPPTTYTPRIYFTPETRPRDTWHPRTVKEIVVI